MGERAIVVSGVRRILDVVLLRLAIFLVAAQMLAPLVAHAYTRVWPARWREPKTWPRVPERNAILPTGDFPE